MAEKRRVAEGDGKLHGEAQCQEAMDWSKVSRRGSLSKGAACQALTASSLALREGGRQGGRESSRVDGAVIPLGLDSQSQRHSRQVWIFIYNL